MYRPPLSGEDDPAAIHAAMRAIGAATFVTPTAQGLLATRAPVVLREEEGALVLAAHVARANPHWRALAGAPGLAIFDGPQAYMSPAHYPTKAETGKVVPTWLYVSVHAHGRAEAVEDPAWLRAQVEALTDLHEAARPAPWAVSDAPDGYIAAMLRGIVGLRFRVERLEAAFKLNEEEPAADRDGTRAGLAEAAAAGDASADALGREMDRRRRGA